MLKLTYHIVMCFILLLQFTKVTKNKTKFFLPRRWEKRRKESPLRKYSCFYRMRERKKKFWTGSLGYHVFTFTWLLVPPDIFYYFVISQYCARERRDIFLTFSFVFVVAFVRCRVSYVVKVMRIFGGLLFVSFICDLFSFFWVVQGCNKMINFLPFPVSREISNHKALCGRLP